MDINYSWQNPIGQATSFKTETTRNLGWWILLAILVSVVVHVVLYLILGAMQWAGAAPAPKPEQYWHDLRRQQEVVIPADVIEQFLPAPQDAPKDEPKPEPGSADLVTKELDEFEMMEKLKDEPVRLTPAVDAAQIIGSDRPMVAKATLTAHVAAMEVSASEVLSQDLKSMRQKLLDTPIASAEQPVLALGADDVANTVDSQEFLRSLAKKSFGQKADTFLKGYSDIDTVIGATGGDLPPGGQKFLLPTDIVFDYNEYEVKEQARLSLMKLAFLIQTNPTATFTIEGHTDLFGSDEANQALSQQRANAVREWFITNLKINPSNIQTVGRGRSAPIVPGGTIEEQAINRRVEIVVKK